MATPSKSPAIPPVKKSNPVTQMETEVNTLRLQIDEARSRLQSLQGELAGLLALRAGAAKHRRPLEEAVGKAVLGVKEAQEALSRHLGSPNESTFADKLFEANAAKEAAETALQSFDRRHEAREREAKLRAGIAEAQESLSEMERRQATLTHELDQALAHAVTLALVRVLNAFADLYEVLSVDGPTLARTRISDPLLYRDLMTELPMSQQDLFELIAGGYDRQGNYDENWRPALAERQQIIRDRLAALQK